MLLAVPRLMVMPAVLLRRMTVPVLETVLMVLVMSMVSVVRVMPAPEGVLIVPCGMLIPKLLAPLPPVPITETVPVPPALIWPLEPTYTPSLRLEVPEPPPVPVTATRLSQVL